MALHFENLAFFFSSLSFTIHVNLLHPEPSSFFFRLFLPLWCLSTLANYHLKVSFQLTTIIILSEELEGIMTTKTTQNIVMSVAPLTSRVPLVKFKQ